MPEKAIDLDRSHKLAASMHNPNRNEALNAFNAFLAELAKADEAQFSVEYSLGNMSPEDTEEAERELSRLRDELAEAFESTARDETTDRTNSKSSTGFMSRWMRFIRLCESPRGRRFRLHRLSARPFVPSQSK